MNSWIALVRPVTGHGERTVGVAVHDEWTDARPTGPRRRRSRPAGRSGRVWGPPTDSRDAAPAKAHRRGSSPTTARASSSKRCAQANPWSGWEPSMRPKLCTTLPLATISTPRSRSGARRSPRSKWYSSGSSPLMASWITGTSAAGYMCASTDHVPWSMPQLSRSRPTQRGSSTVTTSCATSSDPGHGYSNEKSSSGNPKKSWIVRGPVHGRDRGRVRVPVGGDGEDRPRAGERPGQVPPGIGVAVVLQSVHRAAMPDEQQWQWCLAHLFTVASAGPTVRRRSVPRWWPRHWRVPSTGPSSSCR